MPDTPGYYARVATAPGLPGEEDDLRRVLTCMVIAGVTSAAASAQPPATPETTVDATRGGVTISSGNNSLTIGARPQFRWTVDDKEQFDGDTAGDGVGEDDGVMSDFDVIRLRVSLSGGVYRPWMRYLFQFDFSRTPGQDASKIKDAVFEIRPTGRSYSISMGQFKAPFGLQQLTSSGRQQFVDRSITDSKFTPGREMGAMVSGTLAARKIGYAVGAFNGSGESTRQNNRSQLWAGRIFFDPLGVYPLAEGATDAGENLLLHFGAAVRGGKQIRGRTASGVVDDADNQTAFDLELAVKTPRFYSTAEYFWMTDEQQNPTPGPDFDSRGYHAQAAVMLLPRTVEVAVRYARVDGDVAVDEAGLTELRGAFSYYWQGHNLKLQADIGQLGYGENFAGQSSRARQGLPALGSRLVTGEALSDRQFRLQFTIIF
jgi:phosphate-selective porin OprO/OprP